MSEQGGIEELREEARRWDTRELTPAGWHDAPDAVPRAGETAPITIRMPKNMVRILKEFAQRENIGYQVLIKRWLDERIRVEAAAVRERHRIEARVKAQQWETQSLVQLHQPHVERWAAATPFGAHEGTIVERVKA